MWVVRAVAHGLASRTRRKSVTAAASGVQVVLSGGIADSSASPRRRHGGASAVLRDAYETFEDVDGACQRREVLRGQVLHLAAEGG